MMRFFHLVPALLHGGICVGAAFRLGEAVRYTAHVDIVLTLAGVTIFFAYSAVACASHAFPRRSGT